MTGVGREVQTIDRYEAVLHQTMLEAGRLVRGRRTLVMSRAQVQQSLRATRRSFDRVRNNRDEALTELTMPSSQRAQPGARDRWRLHVAYKHRRDAQVLDRLVTAYLPRTDQRARLMTRQRADLDDRTQVAREALVLALQRFEPARRVPFEAFLDITVRGQLLKDIRDRGWLVRAPRRVHELYPPMRAATDRLTQELRRPPTPDELADELGVAVDDILMVLTAQRARIHRSLESMELEARDRSTPTSRFDEADPLRRALALLCPTDRKLVHDYFVRNMTQQQIADELHVSQMSVSRQLRRVVRLLGARVAIDA